MKEPHASTLAIPDMGGHIERITTTHIREQIDAMSDEERFFAAAYLQHLGNDSDEQRKATLEARMARMDGGRNVDVQQIR